MLAKVSRVLVALGVVVSGCTTTSNAPATTPSTTAATSETTISPGSVVTTTNVETSTTVDRLTEIAAIFEDIERRRLQAIYDQDEPAFRSLYANAEFLSRSLQLLEVVVFIRSPEAVDISVDAVLADLPTCLTAQVVTDLTGITLGGGRAAKQQTLEYTGQNWGISYVGDDWRCEGPHPLSSP